MDVVTFLVASGLLNVLAVKLKGLIERKLSEKGGVVGKYVKRIYQDIFHIR